MLLIVLVEIVWICDACVGISERVGIEVEFEVLFELYWNGAAFAEFSRSNLFVLRFKAESKLE